MTPARSCRQCGAAIRLLQTEDGKWRPVEAAPLYMTLDPDGPDQALCEKTGRYERGTIGPVQPGKPWVIIHKAHCCQAGGAERKYITA